MSAQTLRHLHFVDDSPDEFLVTRLIFRKEKIDLKLHAHHALDEFVAHVRKIDADELDQSIIVTDLNLAVGSGIDVINAVRAEPNLERLIAGVCSGSNDPADRLAAIEAGADFFVTKSLDKRALHEICSAVPRLSLGESADQKLQIWAKPLGGLQ